MYSIEPEHTRKQSHCRITAMFQEYNPMDPKLYTQRPSSKCLISVTNKTGLEKFKPLCDHNWQFASTGGTATALRNLGFDVTDVAQLTNFPEMLNGRVKTLHPRIFGGILGIRSNAEHMAQLREHSIPLMDMVVVNLYDFKSRPSIEEIDIGGPSICQS